MFSRSEDFTIFAKRNMLVCPAGIVTCIRDFVDDSRAFSIFSNLFTVFALIVDRPLLLLLFFYMHFIFSQTMWDTFPTIKKEPSTTVRISSCVTFKSMEEFKRQERNKGSVQRKKPNEYPEKSHCHDLSCVCVPRWPCRIYVGLYTTFSSTCRNLRIVIRTILLHGKNVCKQRRPVMIGMTESTVGGHATVHYVLCWLSYTRSKLSRLPRRTRSITRTDEKIWLTRSTSCARQFGGIELINSDRWLPPRRNRSISSVLRFCSSTYFLGSRANGSARHRSVEMHWSMRCVRW